MILEPLQPLRVTVNGQSQDLVPGQLVQLTEAQGRKLLAKAPGRVRRVFGPPTPRLLGEVVSWDSPLFGLLRAAVLEETNVNVRVIHPLTDQEATIPKSWVIQSSPE